MTCAMASSSIIAGSRKIWNRVCKIVVMEVLCMWALMCLDEDVLEEEVSTQRWLFNLFASMKYYWLGLGVDHSSWQLFEHNA